jgi:RNA polymerase sigma-70 factor (ECF subfamily)
MHELAGRFAGDLVTDGDDLAREFEARLSDSTTLAFRVAFSVLRHRQDAEDVAQEAFARAHRKFDRLRDRDRFRAWLVRMTWRLALDHRRSARRRIAREEVTAVPPVAAAGIEDRLLVAERSARLWAAIDSLPSRLGRVLILQAIEEHSVADVAALLGLPEGTVKSRLFEARRRLQEMLR